MPLVHPDDWKTRRVARILAVACIPHQWNKIAARKAMGVLCDRMGYSFREAWQLATTHYPLTLEEIERTIN